MIKVLKIVAILAFTGCAGNYRPTAGDGCYGYYGQALEDCLLRTRPSAIMPEPYGR